MSNCEASLNQLYELLALQEANCGGKRRLAQCDGYMNWPKRGVYFFFEDGELRTDAVTPRVVRAGTHALKPSRSSMWKRLSQHRGPVGGSMPGGGNHRGSIFRLHVGSALLATGDWPDSIRGTWGHESSAPLDVRQNEYPLELEVSNHIRSMPFIWVEVDDPPGHESDRGVIEAGTIALLGAGTRQSIDEPSTEWLGRQSDREAIRESGLWNVEHTADRPVEEFLSVLEHYVIRVTAN